MQKKKHNEGNLIRIAYNNEEEKPSIDSFENPFEKLIMDKIAKGSKNIFKIQKKDPLAEKESKCFVN